MDDIGFMCHIKPHLPPELTFRPYELHRVVPMDRLLRAHQLRLFIYSPVHINPHTGVSLGYQIKHGRFEPVIRAVPKINGNWMLRMPRLLNDYGMGYNRFVRWSHRHRIRMYVPLEFADLVNDKLLTYRFVRGLDPRLHAHTELFQGDINHLEQFFKRSRLIYLKPLFGGMGNQILVLKKCFYQYELRFYKNRNHTENSVYSLDALYQSVNQLIGKRQYVIQEGIYTKRYQKGVFDVRVILFQDGKKWGWIHKAKLSQPDKDVSNTAQGAKNYVTDELLHAMYGTRRARRIMNRLHDTSFNLAYFINQQFAGLVPEVALDFLVDTHDRVVLCEINGKPGMKVPRPFNDIFNLTPEEMLLYNHMVKPHVEALGHFFINKYKETKE